MAGEYNPFLKAAEAELAALLKRKAAIDKEKALVDQTVEAVARTVDDLRKVYGIPTERSEVAALIDSDLGITDQVRAVLKLKSNATFEPTEIIAELERRRVPLTKYSNAAAVVHQVLRRLFDQDEIEITESHQRKLYKWKSKPSIRTEPPPGISPKNRLTGPAPIKK